MTFLELCRAVRTECSVAGVGPDTVAGQSGTYAKLVNWVRQSYIEIQNRYINWKFLHAHYVHSQERMMREFAGDVDSPSIAPPDDLNIWSLDTFTLFGQQVDVVEYHDKTVTLEYGVEKPAVIVLPDNSLLVQNLEAGVFPSFQADYYRKPQILKKNDDVPWMPEQFHYLIVYRAMMMYGNYDNATEIKSAGIEGWQDMMPILEANQLPLHSQTLMPNQQELVVRVE